MKENKSLFKRREKPENEIVSIKKQEKNELSNIYIEGTDLTLEGIPEEERVFVQGAISKAKIYNALSDVVSRNHAGSEDYTQSPIYKKFNADTEVLVQELSLILRTMAGEITNDFRKLGEKKKDEKSIGPKAVDKIDISKDEGLIEEEDFKRIKIGRGERPFPYYNELLSSYVAGRYEFISPNSKVQSKPGYRNMPFMMNYFEKMPLERESFDAYLDDPIGGIQLDKKDISIKVAREIYEGEKKFDFRYEPSQKARQIFGRLKSIYIQALKKLEDRNQKLDTWLLPQKEVDGKTIYIDDSLLKSANIISLASSLKAQALLDSMITANMGTYEIHYIPLTGLTEILNSILGDENWVIQTTYTKSWNGNDVVRGYYVDTLGNFKYGQLVTPPQTFGNNDVDKDQSRQSKLARALITEVFQALHGLNEQEFARVKEMKENVIRASVSEAMILYDKKLKHQEIGLIEPTSMKPLKRIADLHDERPAKRLLTETKENEEPKEMTRITGLGIRIEEKE